MKYKILAILMCLTSAVHAQDSLLPDASGSLSLGMPGSGSTNQSDRFRAGNLDCSNSIGSATRFEMGVMGIINQGEYYGINSSEERVYIDDPFRDIGLYGRIVIPLGAKPKSRIDCNRLYELELRARQLEVIKLEQEVQQLKDLQFGE